MRNEDSEAVLKQFPSCLGLPIGWTDKHDRCIAYLATHAPLTSEGRVPNNESSQERYTYAEISSFLRFHFTQFRGFVS